MPQRKGAPLSRPEPGWTDTAVRDEVEGLVFSSAGQAVVAILAVLHRHGYDSIDRELSFVIAADRLGVPYDDLYHAWLGQPAKEPSEVMA